jgi:hypothetical protein
MPSSQQGEPPYIIIGKKFLIMLRRNIIQKFKLIIFFNSFIFKGFIFDFIVILNEVNIHNTKIRLNDIFFFNLFVLK